MVYGDIVLWAVFTPIVLVALLYSGRALIGWTQVRREARDDFAYRSDHHMLPASITQDDFVRVYRRVNGPRSEIHVAVALWSVLLATPVIAKGLEVLLEGLYQATGQSRVFEPGFLVWQFFIFFGLFAAWSVIAFAVARWYHRRSPGRFDEELRAAAGHSSRIDPPVDP